MLSPSLPPLQDFTDSPVDIQGEWRRTPEDSVRAAFEVLKSKFKSGPPEMILWILDQRKTSPLYGEHTSSLTGVSVSLL